MGEMSLLPPTGLHDRISPEYLEIQRKYHEQRKSYGTIGSVYAEQVKSIATDHGIKSVLDYGCGKGALKSELLDLDVREYDPAIPGKDGEPEPADLVVCTDVLEHIEPDKIDNVIEHIRCLGQWVYLTIATRPATKDLPDGRNAHILIRDAEWWRTKLNQTFDILTFDVQKLGVMVFARPFTLIGEINGVGVMDYSQRLEHIKTNCRVTKKRLRPDKFVRWNGEDMPMFGVRLGFEGSVPKWGIPKPNNRVAIIMCYGPSLNDTWQMALDEKEFIDRSDIVSVSGAHDFLIERGIIPKYHIECDPRLHKGDMMQKLHPLVEYYMATVCHPDLVRRLKNHRLTLWHMNEGDPSLQILDIEPNAILVPGGGSVGLRSLALLYIMGYRRFLIHGMDCSYRDGATHAGKHTGKEIKPVEVRCTDGRKFFTAPVLITYKRYFDDIRRSFVGDADNDASKIEIILRGDGLLQHWLRLLGGAETHQPEAA